MSEQEMKARAEESARRTMTREEVESADGELKAFLKEFMSKYPCGLFMTAAFPLNDGQVVRLGASLCNGPIGLGCEAVRHANEKQGAAMMAFLHDALSRETDPAEKAEIERLLGLLEAVEGIAGEAARG